MTADRWSRFYIKPQGILRVLAVWFVISCLTVFAEFSYSVELVLPGQKLIESQQCLELIESHNLRLQTQISSKRYEDRRGLYSTRVSYLSLLGDSLGARINELGPDDIILDLGAGIGLAIKEYLTAEKIYGLQNLPDLNQRAQGIFLGYEQPLPNEELDPLISKIETQMGGPRLGVNHGRRFQDIPDEELSQWNGKISEIWSVYGVLDYLKVQEYTHQLNRVLHLLAHNGEMRLFFDLKNLRFNDQNGLPFSGTNDLSGLEKDEEEVLQRILHFFENIQGVKVKEFSKRLQSVRLVLQRTEGEIKIPKIFPLDHFPGAPPTRIFYYPGFEAPLQLDSQNNILKLIEHWMKKQSDQNKITGLVQIVSESLIPINPFKQGASLEDAQIDKIIQRSLDLLPKDQWPMISQSIKELAQNYVSVIEDIEKVDRKSTKATSFEVFAEVPLDTPASEGSRILSTTLPSGQSYMLVPTENSSSISLFHLQLYSVGSDPKDLKHITQLDLTDILPPGVSMKELSNLKILSSLMPLDEHHFVFAVGVGINNASLLENEQMPAMLLKVDVRTGETKSLGILPSSFNPIFVTLKSTDSKNIYLYFVQGLNTSRYGGRFAKYSFEDNDYTIIEDVDFEKYTPQVQIEKSDNGDILWFVNANNSFQAFLLDHQDKLFKSILDGIDLNNPIIPPKTLAHKISKDKWLISILSNSLMGLYTLDLSSKQFAPLKFDVLNFDNIRDLKYLHDPEGNLYLVLIEGFGKNKVTTFKFDWTNSMADLVSQNDLSSVSNQQFYAFKDSSGRDLFVVEDESKSLHLFEIDLATGTLINLHSLTHQKKGFYLGDPIPSKNGSPTLFPVIEEQTLRLYRVGNS